MKTGMMIGVVASAILIGAISGWFGPLIALSVVGLVGMAALLINDYRIGVVALVLVVPFSGAYDQAANVFMVLGSLTLGAFILGKAHARRSIAGLPRFALVGLVLTVLVGALIGFTHLGEAQVNLPASVAESFSPKGYFRQALLFPLGMVLVSWLLANAIRDSKRPDLFLFPLAMVGIVMTARIVALIATSGLDLEQIQGRREFFSALGQHANEFGPLLAVACGPFLFLAADSRGARRWLYGGVLAMLLCGVTLVFSRGGYVAFLVVLSTFLVMRGRLRVFIGVIVAAILLGFLLPDAVLERATTGMDARSIDMAANRSGTDELTAGRFYLYSMFAPEILKSPLWGSGTGSNAWSVAVRNGWTTMLHPHNLYLRALMDVGVLGLIALAFFWWKTIKGMKRLSTAADVPPTMRSYFAGAFAGCLGAMVAGFSGGEWAPSVGHPFLWYSVGMAFGFWDLARAATKLPFASTPGYLGTRPFGNLPAARSKPAR